MTRRELIALLGTTAAAWPLGARAQQPERMRRIGVLHTVVDDPQARAQHAALVRGLQELGWKEGQNVQLETRWATADHERIPRYATRWATADRERVRRYVADLVALDLDVIVAPGNAIAALQRATRSVPIVFTQVSDPVGAGLVKTLTHPGGNITGFMNFEYGISGKWLELLKETAPSVTRAAFIRDSSIAEGPAQLGALQGAAASSGVELSSIGAQDAEEIERNITAFALSSSGGVIVPAGRVGVVYRELIIALTAQHLLPSVASDRIFVTAGGLISYGPDRTDEYRRAAGYVDRILRGEKPADLPVQAPTRYELVINLKTAKALGLDVPPTLLARADEVIE
jgi:putative tryptophan/tyrosine transport system substrate-binding protein